MMTPENIEKFYTLVDTYHKANITDNQEIYQQIITDSQDLSKNIDSEMKYEAMLSLGHIHHYQKQKFAQQARYTVK